MTILLKNANIYDGTINMLKQENKMILIENDKIKQIGDKITGKFNKVIDLNGAYVVPGLINLHVHLPSSGRIKKKKVTEAQKLIKFITSNSLTRRIGVELGAKYAKVELYSGVTTLRAVGGVANFDSRLANLILNKGKVGPRIIAADTAIGVPHGHMDGVVAKACNSIDEAIDLVIKNKENGAHLIKLMITGGVLDCKVVGEPGDLMMSEEMVKACCDKAHELGLKVAAHVEGIEGVKIAITNGVDSIEHGSIVDEEYLDILKARNGAEVLTLSPAIPLALIDSKELGYSDDAKITSNVLLDRMVKFANACLEKDILVGLGTDTACPLVTHYDFYRELIYFKKYVNNVTNSFALHTATEVNATILGLEKEIGTVKENKCADLLIVKDDPLSDLNALKEPLMVIARGKIYKKKIKRFKEVEEKLNKVL